MTKKRVIILILAVTLVAFGVIVGRSTLFRAAEDGGSTSTKTSGYALKIAVSEQGDDGEYRANFGRISVTGDCTEATNQKSAASVSGRNGMSCQLIQKPLTGQVMRDSDEYLISAISFDSERQGRIINLPITGEDSLSPLRLKKSTTLLFRISNSGVIELSKTELL